MIEAHSLTRKQLREYGLMMGAVIGGLFGVLLPLIFSRPFRTWPWALVLFFWSLALIFPMGLKWVHAAWVRFGHFMGKINSSILLSIFYGILFVPVALLMRIVGRDRLERRWDSKRKSYKQRRSGSETQERMERPF